MTIAWSALKSWFSNSSSNNLVAVFHDRKPALQSKVCHLRAKPADQLMIELVGHGFRSKTRNAYLPGLPCL